MATEAQLLEMENRLASLADGNHSAKAADPFLSRLDNLLPVAAISTKDFAYTKRWIPGPTRQRLRLNRSLTPYNDGIMDAMDMPGVRVVAVKGPVRGGKALDLSTPLPTPSGWTTMGSVEIGDELFDESGGVCVVTAKSPVHYGHDCFAVRFSDGASIVADAEHIWAVEMNNGRDWRRAEMTTAQMLDRGVVMRRGAKRFRIDVAHPLQLPERVLPIDPYVLGVWLGDGTSLTGSIHIADCDVEIARNIEARGYVCERQVSKDPKVLKFAIKTPEDLPDICNRGHDRTLLSNYPSGKCRACGLEDAASQHYGEPRTTRPRANFNTLLRASGLIGNKHIPIEYLRASEFQRMELLRGLMDTDGHIDKGGGLSISSSYPKLAHGILELMRSLGIKPGMTTRIPKFSYKGEQREGMLEHRINFTCYDDRPVVKLARRLVRMKPAEAGRARDIGTRRILSIEPVSSRPVQCIAVSSPSSLYLAGREMIPTHNTIAAENKAVKNWTYGPLVNMLWLMQTKDDLNDYVDERVTWMLQNHEEVSEKIDWSDSRNGRSRMVIGGALALWRAATLQALRGKAAPFIVCDEVDAYPKRVRRAIKTLIEARQLEFGANTLAYFCSHPDAGPTEGIDDLISMGVKHMWWWNCLDCGGSSSPSVGADVRMGWNVSDLLKKREDMDKVALLDMVQKEARLSCPHCGSIIDNKMRLEMSPGGVWLQPHQKLHEDGGVEGDQKVHRTMGFEMHAFMTPFAELGALARGWSEAWLKFADTGEDTDLKEQTVKRMGETYQPAAASKRIDDEKVVKARLQSSYQMKTVPAGVMFLTAFVDIQGDRFEVVVIGWDLQMRSWLIDRFPIKQWPGFDTIDPSNRVSDYRIIEHAVINQRYMIAGTASLAEPLYLPIARTMVNAAGGGSGEDGDTPGVTTAARKWMAEAITEGRFEPWQVNLFQGNAHKNAEPYGRARPLEFDEHGQAYPVQIYERTLNVHKIKSVIALRMQVRDPAAAGRMFIPMEIKPRYVKEMVSEKFINDAWTRMGANETWDGYVACEAARFYLDPTRPGLWSAKDPITGLPKLPIWATPVTRGAPTITPAALDAQGQTDYYARLTALNGG